MTDYGLTAAGFVLKPASVIDAEIADAQRASPALGADWDTSAESPSGQLNASIATKLAELWELAAVLYNACDPRNASFAALDAVCSLTGTVRSPATKGTATLTLRVAAGRTIPAGSIASVINQPTNRWVTLTAAVNASGSDADVIVTAEAEAAGALVANAGTITVIATPVVGWLSVTNAADAATGSESERDPALRVRREKELGALGTSPVDAIRAALRRVSGVSVAEIAENDADVIVDGMPPHSIEAVVQGGTDAAVALALWRAKAGGIQLYTSVRDEDGNPITSVTIADAGGFSRVIVFTRPVTVSIYARIVVLLSDRYAGDIALAAAVANVTAGQGAGATVRKSSIITAALAVAGVIDCTAVLLGRTVGSRADTNLIADPREVLKLSAERVEIVVGTV